MIIYKLGCETGHEFEGWFSDSQDYDNQKAKGLLSCPMCNSQAVNRLLAGVPLIKSSQATAEKPLPAKADDGRVRAAVRPGMIGGQRGSVDPVLLLKALDQYVKTNFENVGDKFYEETVKIHKGEAPARNLTGEVTAEQREQLDTQEIPYMVIPKLSPKFDN